MWSSGATLLALLLVFVRPALGDPCVLTMGSQYQLKSDTVDWTMQTSSGQSCIRGLRYARVTIETAKLVSPPQSGQLKLLGSGFSYTAKSDFQGQDSFTIQVSGMLNGIRGSSDIRIIVSVGPNVSPQTSPTERSDRSPGDLSSAGQPNQSPTAQGTNQTRQVRPANADTSMSPSTRPARILPSQQGTGPLQQGTGTDQTIGSLTLSGNKILDIAGHPFSARGVEFISTDQVVHVDNIAATGANSFRLLILLDIGNLTPANIDALLAEARAKHMVVWVALSTFG